MKRVGFWLSEKKMKKFDFDSFAELYKSKDLCFEKIDLSRPIEEQGYFDCIIHNFFELIILVNIGTDNGAPKQLEYVQNYIKSHPETILIDPIDKTYFMLSRAKHLTAAIDVVQHPKLRGHVIVPTFCGVNSSDSSQVSQCMKEAGVTYPVVCKPDFAHGKNQSHQMRIIFNEKDLKDFNGPYVLQSFINHNAELFKVFVIGKHIFVRRRNSIKNLKDGDFKTVYFQTFEVCWNNSHSILSEMDDTNEGKLLAEPDYKLLRKIARICRSTFKLDLFGLDVIISANTAQYAIIDVNAFPGYDRLPDFFVYLERLVREKLQLPILNDIKNGLELS